MNKEHTRQNLKMGGSATHYCKYCNTYGTPNSEYDKQCGNCSQVGYLMLNPFPDNLVPYIEFDQVTGDKLDE